MRAQRQSLIWQSPLTQMHFLTRYHNQEEGLSSIINGIKVLVQDFVHGEHVDLVLFEHFSHRFVANYLALVLWVL